MATASNNCEQVRTQFACARCKGKGLTYEGSGHRMAGYPYAEKTVLTVCSCEAGKRLDADEPGALAREMAAQSVADDLMAEVTQ